ncbi:MAG: molybdopterin dehydrogenase [Sneathiella sp.]|jgi:carbon-monoxide dehydrogenase medium subunit|uniref:FAD binding domain-containing protein n=1 Tax=Sneathiella sp. TaxID=1964365 RepID=UPI000C5ABB7A|nr:xanthine dehydrogenase family protein subunit M [Sneathiella sp.]MAL80775.1 molybdopterin dehydrogenase [Sneathiella sp.]|tara:strand:+ start:3886 stop:4737 length:852 start_codon:yes stop_codon:yes gene_type:complete
MTYEILKPETLQDAFGLLDTDDPMVRPFSGGTALMLMMKSGIFSPSRLVVLRDIPGLNGIRLEEDGSLWIGALTTLAELEKSDLVAQHAPVVTHALRHLSNRRVRNVARIGGALAHGDPHMDLPPLLSALNAEVIVEGSNQGRRISVQDLVTGYYETSLESNELIVAVRIPSQQSWQSAYRKFTARSADDWPALGVAVSLNASRNEIQDLRLVVGAATERPTRLEQSEGILRQEGRSGLERATEAAMASVEFMDDAHGSSQWKKALLRVELRRAVQEILDRNT